MSGVIPQKVNVTHALQSSVVEKMKEDIKEYQNLAELSQEQMETVNTYIDSLDSAFTQFCMDNDHVEKRKEGVTSADVELFEGLKNMYSTYMSQLSQIKQERLKKEQEVGKDQPLEYIRKELPYVLPADRFDFVNELILKGSNSGLVKSAELLKAMQQLALIDGSLKKNLRIYRDFLERMGYTSVEIINSLPHLSDDDSILPPETNIVQNELTPEDFPQESLSEEKKRISFSKYLKKDGKEINENGKRTLTTDDEDYQNGVKLSKKSNTSSSIKNIGLIPILKTEHRKKSKPINGIQFVDDSKLVTVFGDDLPAKGLVTSARKLKKILKPFKEGEPAEFELGPWKEQSAQPLLIEIGPIKDSDISEIKNGPISINSNVTLGLRRNFISFSPDLNKAALEPVHIEDTIEDASNGKRKQRNPIIARAFGKNSLLLRKDRGGLPYKRVPEVIRNSYPLRPHGPSDDLTSDKKLAN